MDTEEIVIAYTLPALALVATAYIVVMKRDGKKTSELNTVLSEGGPASKNIRILAAISAVALLSISILLSSRSSDVTYVFTRIASFVIVAFVVVYILKKRQNGQR